MVWIIGSLKLEHLFFFSFNNSDKGAVTHAVVHRALWEYLSTVNGLSDETESEKLRREMFDRYEEIFACFKFFFVANPD